MKVAMYARVSRPDENLENQLRRLRSYAEAEGYEVTGIYQDVRSGADANRPDLDRMMTDARGHRFSLILVVKIDRIARSMTNLHAMLVELEATKVKFHCVDQPEVSTDTPTGKLILNVLGAVAEFERELIRERTKAGLARVRAEGKRLGRPNTAIDMRRVAELRAAGWGIRRIAKDLKIAPETLRRGLKNEVGKSPSE